MTSTIGLPSEPTEEEVAEYSKLGYVLVQERDWDDMLHRAAGIELEKRKSRLPVLVAEVLAFPLYLLVFYLPLSILWSYHRIECAMCRNINYSYYRISQIF